MEVILSVVSVALGIAGLAYAIYQSVERRRLQEYVRSQNWHLYAKANVASGSIQEALRAYKSSAGENVDPQVIEWLARADAFAQDVFKDTIRQIQFSEPKFDASTIQAWISEGRVGEKHGTHFRNLAPSERRKVGVGVSDA